MTLGDVLAVVAGVLGLAVTGIAILLAMVLIFPRTTERARQHVLKPWRAFFVGLLVALTLGVLALVLLNVPNPVVKILGWVLFSWLCVRLLIGMAGLLQVMAERIRERAPHLSDFTALACASVVLTIALFFPGVGWLFLAPIIGTCSLGAGMLALAWPKSPRATKETQPEAKPREAPIEDWSTVEVVQ